MYISETIISNLLIEIDSLAERLKNIKQAFYNTSHKDLRKRLICENQKIIVRVSEIVSIAHLLEKRNNEEICFSKLLVEKSRRTISYAKMESNLFLL